MVESTEKKRKERRKLRNNIEEKDDWERPKEEWEMGKIINKENSGLGKLKKKMDFYVCWVKSG